MSDSRSLAIAGLGMGTAALWGAVRYYLPTAVTSTIESTLSSGLQSAEQAALYADAEFQEMYQQAWESSASGLPTVEISPDGVVSAAIKGAAQFVQPQNLNASVAQSGLQCLSNETIPDVRHFFANQTSPADLVRSFEQFVNETCPSNQTAVSLVNSAHEMLNQTISKGSVIGPDIQAPEQFVTTLFNFVNQTVGSGSVPVNASSQLFCENLVNYANATIPNSEVAKGAMELLQSVSPPPVVPVPAIPSESVMPAMPPTLGKYLYGGYNLYKGVGALRDVYDLIVNNRTLAQAGKTALSIMNVPMLMDQVLDPIAKAYAGEDKPEEQAMFKQYIQMGLFAIQSAVVIGSMVMSRQQRNAAKEQEQLGFQYLSALAEAVQNKVDPTTVKKPEKLKQETADKLLIDAQALFKKKLEADAVAKAAVVQPAVVLTEPKPAAPSQYEQDQLSKAKAVLGQDFPVSRPLLFSEVPQTPGLPRQAPAPTTVEERKKIGDALRNQPGKKR